ncbi:putative RNA-binding protein [Exophiala dermatitidis]
MFIGGLNWETTDQSLHDYFSQFGEVQECTVMRDSATGRSRGFGFLTFKDPKTVNTVMVKEHFLDGKIIDPKRAIPRDEQEKTAKIFVGGVSQDATEEDFESFFAQFGRVIDATLMMDKDTGRPRGFGFVTFDSDAAVERCLEYHPLEILGKPIEVKRAQPRGKMGELNNDDGFRGGRGRGKFGGGGGDDRYGGGDHGGQSAQNGSNQAGNMMGGNGMTPQMMAQYWQRMQQYFAMMQQQMAAQMMGGMGGMGMGQMNPQMMQQMMQMQKMQQQGGGNSPNPQNAGSMGNMAGMTPQMMQQMMQMQQQGGMNMGGGGNRGAPMGPGASGGGSGRGSFSAQEQMAFEQQKYEQQARRSGSVPQGPRGQGQGFQNQGQSPQSWEGMYDDVPQPDGGRGSAGPVRNMTPKPPKGPGGGGGGTGQPSAAPANAPTGPKNAGRPGNFRGRGGGRFHPYGR